MNSDRSLPALEPLWDNFPVALRAVDRWVLWRFVDGKKVPLSARTKRPLSVTSAKTGSTFDEARTTYMSGDFHGVGFVLAGDGIVGVDLDDCVVDGEPTAAARRVLEELGCQYVELSPSGRGLRGFGLSPGCDESAVYTRQGVRLELYAARRYLTVTGHRLQRPGGLEDLSAMPGFARLVNEKREHRASHVHSTQETQAPQEHQVPQEPEGSHVTQDPQELKERQERYAGGAKASIEILGVFVELPSMCLPTGAGTRHRAVFQLARFLRARAPGATEDQLYDIFGRWHSLVLDDIRTKDIALSWADFLTAWRNVRNPYGELLVHILSAGEEPLPAWMRDHRFGELGDKLLRMCLALARHHSPKPFFLTYRVAAEILGCHFTHVGAMLRGMVASGYLELVRTGARGVGSTYRVGKGRLDAAAKPR